MWIGIDKSDALRLRLGDAKVSAKRLKRDAREICGKTFCTDFVQDRAFDAFDDFSDFVESISCETSKSCQVRGSNPCRGAIPPMTFMSRITTPFSVHSTASDIIEGINLTGRRAIVTGGASGIGIETARALAGAGASVTRGGQATERFQRRCSRIHSRSR